MKKLSLREKRNWYFRFLIWGFVISVAGVVAEVNGLGIGVFYIGMAIIVGSIPYAMWQLRCPACGKWLSRETIAYMNRHPYCSHCGTKIDWDAK